MQLGAIDCFPNSCFNKKHDRVIAFLQSPFCNKPAAKHFGNFFLFDQNFGIIKAARVLITTLMFQ